MMKVCRETVFHTRMITPELAAKLADCASQYEAEVELECGGKTLSLDSLICILSMELYEGVSVLIHAEGEDAEAAADAIVALL